MNTTRNTHDNAAPPRTYAEAYAMHYPRYARYYRLASYHACIGARIDIIDTMRVVQATQRMGDPYVGKLYAELDAVRERIRAIEAREGESLT